MKDDLRGWRLGRVVTVVDRGCSSEENLRCLTRAGGHWIAGEKLRDGSADARAALSRQGRYRRVRDNLRVMDVRVGAGDAARRFIVCHNPEEAERDRAKRDDAIARLTAELERIAAARARTRSREQRSRRDAEEAAHTKAECALRDHRTLGRYLRQTSAGRLVVDRAKIAVEARLDGKFLLSTSDPDLCAEDVALGYKSLLEAERGFRDLKTTLELRPVFHRLERRIRAHVLLCWLALLLIRVAAHRRPDLAADRPGARPRPRGHPRRRRRRRHPDHRADRRPTRHLPRPRHRATAAHHPPRPRLSAIHPSRRRGHTPRRALDRRFRTSTPGTRTPACPSTAELGSRVPTFFSTPILRETPSPAQTPLSSSSCAR